MWTLKCLLCGVRSKSLVDIQEHAMRWHHYSQQDMREQTKRMVNKNFYIYTFPDNKDWLEAIRVEVEDRNDAKTSES